LLTKEQLEAGLNCNTKKCKDCIWFHESKNMLKDRCTLSEEKILRHGIEVLAQNEALKERISDYEGIMTNMEDRNKELKEMLKRLEWDKTDDFCPECRRYKNDGHAPECQLAKLLEVKEG